MPHNQYELTSIVCGNLHAFNHSKKMEIIFNSLLQNKIYISWMIPSNKSHMQEYSIAPPNTAKLKLFRFAEESTIRSSSNTKIELP